MEFLVSRVSETLPTLHPLLEDWRYSPGGLILHPIISCISLKQKWNNVSPPETYDAQGEFPLGIRDGEHGRARWPSCRGRLRYYVFDVRPKRICLMRRLVRPLGQTGYL